MTYKFGRTVAACFVVLLLLVGCSKPVETPQPSETAVPASTPTTFDSPLPAPTPTLTAFESPLPAGARGPSSRDKAALSGLLILTSPELIAPQEDGLYLVEVDTESAALMVFPRVDPETSIQAEVDEVTGQFFFDNVDEGLYAFVVLTLTGQQLSARELETGDAAILTVTENDLNTVIDIGRYRLP
jgi:hypothetical protein